MAREACLSQGRTVDLGDHHEDLTGAHWKERIYFPGRRPGIKGNRVRILLWEERNSELRKYEKQNFFHRTRNFEFFLFSTS